MFSLKGYAATNLTDITDALGVSRGPVYYHFKDKYGLYEAAYGGWETELRDNNLRIYSEPYPGILKLLEQTVYGCLDLYKRYRATFFAGIEPIPELVVQMIYILYDGIRMGWERSELPLKEADVRRIVAIHMEGLERTCCA